MRNIIKSIKFYIKGILKNCGFQITRVIVDEPGMPYERVLPRATYAPWKTNRAFREMYEQIKYNTGVDILRLYELWNLVKQSSKLSGALIEIGVWRGGSGALIAMQAKSSGINDRIYLCDTFKGVVKAGPHDNKYQGGEHSDTGLNIVNNLIFDKLKLTNVAILEGIFPDQTGHLINENEFRFCHIDVDTYESAKGIIDWIWDRLVVGGIIVFDDYGFRGCVGVTKYVEEQALNDNMLFIHNLNGHGIIIKLKQ